MTARLADLPSYIYGTTRLGDDSIDRAQRVEFARIVLDRLSWVHSSDQYGDALDVLGEVIAERPDTPSTILKVGGGSADDVLAVVRGATGKLGIEQVDIGQLSPVAGLDRALVEGGSALDGLRRLKDDGDVGRYVLEIFPWTSAAPLAALRAGNLDGLIDGYIMYLNPLQRFASNALWDELLDRELPLVSMRTVAGSDVHSLRDIPGAAWRPYLRDRAGEIAPVFDGSGVATWSEFCVRFALGSPHVQSTVGSTLTIEHLDAFLTSVEEPLLPLPDDVTDAIGALQRRWSDETDVNAEPWTM